MPTVRVFVSGRSRLACLAVALVCAGCGNGNDVSNRTCVVPNWTSPYGTGGLVTGPRFDIPPTAYVSAFARRRTRADVIPRDKLSGSPGGVARHSRLLAPASGRRGAVYVMPMANRTDLCFYEVGGSGNGGCATSFPESYQYVVGPNQCAHPFFEVVGVVPDGVTRVGLFINRRLHRVAVQDNFFWYETPVTKPQKVNAFVLRYRTGGVAVTALGIGWKPSTAEIARV